jgi:hypothetical protein
MEARLRSGLPESDIDIRTVPLTDLGPVPLTAVLDRIAAGAEFPIVLVGDVVAAEGALDAEAVLAAVRACSS